MVTTQPPPASLTDRALGTQPARWLANMGALSAARLVAPLLRMAVPVWISRALGVDGLGNYQLVMSYFAIYSAVASLGLWDFIVREMATTRARAGGLLVHACALSVAAAIPASLVMVVSALGYNGETRAAMLIMTVALFPSGVSLFADGAFLAFHRASYVAAFMVVEELLLTMLACGALWLGYGLAMIVAVTVAVRLLAAAFRLVLAGWLIGGIEWRIERPIVREMLGQAPVFFGTAVLATLFWRLDFLMLSWLGTATDVGLYAAAFRFVAMCQEVPAAALATLFPRLSALHLESRAAFRALFASAAKYLSLLAIATSVMVTLAGPAAIRLLFGNKFDASVPILQLLIWSLLPFSIMKLLGSMLIATRNQVADLVINAIVLGVSALLKVLLIPAYGPIGAALSTVAAMTVAVALRAGFLWERTQLGTAIAPVSTS